MKTITEYIQRLTITTDDDGARTITRTSSADTRTEFYFSELSPEAQSRAIRDAIEEEERDYCEYGIYGASQTGMSEAEIWDAASYLEKQQPIRFYSDAGGSPAAEARAWKYDPHTQRFNGFWGDACELVSLASDSGICYSMDICDKWNEYAPRIMALVEAIEEAGERRDIHIEAGDTASGNGADDIARAEWARADFYDAIGAKCDEVAEELTEEAARAVGDTVDGLIEAERNYYSSEEFWREWLKDGDDRYTREGERI